MSQERARLTAEDSMFLFGVVYQDTAGKVLHPADVTIVNNPITGHPVGYIAHDPDHELRDVDERRVERENLLPIAKVAQHHPLAKGVCEGCGQPVWYNTALPFVEHVVANLACADPWPRVHDTPCP